jgi:hypothetical protein
MLVTVGDDDVEDDLTRRGLDGGDGGAGRKWLLCGEGRGCGGQKRDKEDNACWRQGCSGK